MVDQNHIHGDAGIGSSQCSMMFLFDRGQSCVKLGFERVLFGDQLLRSANASIRLLGIGQDLVQPHRRLCEQPVGPLRRESDLSAHATALIMLSEVVFASISSVLLGAAEMTARTWVGGALIVAVAAWSARTCRTTPATLETSPDIDTPVPPDPAQEAA